MNIIKIDTCLSTNSLLKELATTQVLQEATILVTKEQTAGRGQRGTYWEAEAGKNLTFSILFYPRFLPLKDHFLLSKAVALAIKEVLDTFGPSIFIKWPNDIYFMNRKLAGILIENEITGQTLSQSIAGTGININQEIFHSTAPNPISLKQITGNDTHLDELLEKLSASLENHYEHLRKGETETIARKYHEALYRKNEFYPYEDKDGIFLARIEAVGNDGLLHLISDKGEKRRYAFKEISFML
jgi:BirA family biotin operon repressor/biotin-[acetyl-CoA-carboxylase] ligase